MRREMETEGGVMTIRKGSVRHRDPQVRGRS